MRFSRTAALCAAALTLVAPALATDFGLSIANQVQVSTWQDFLENRLYTAQGNNRNYNGAHHDLCRNNIVSTLQSFGLPVQLHGFLYNGVTYYNVIAEQRGVLYPDQIYVVGAHYDSVSNAGADDDASGVASVLELARILSQYDTAYTIRYCAWDVEERGLVGSTAYVGDRRSDNIRAMIQLDMIAKDSGANAQDMFGSTTASALKTALAALFPIYGNGTSVQLNGAASFSDHHPFDQAAYPAVCFVEDNYLANTCYHQACDYYNQTNYMNYTFATKLVRVIAGYLADNARAFVADDADHNGVSDAVQIAANPQLDCNGNGILDSIEVGMSADCDADGVPDACEIAAGEPDADADGIPDICEQTRRVPSQYANIQAAITAAVNGDTVLVAPGTYTGTGNKNLNFAGKAIAVRSEAGPANTIIDSQNSGRAFVFQTNEGPNSIVDGFTLRGGNMTIGGGIYCITASPTIQNCIITANVATTSGGGVYAFTRANPTFINCTITANNCVSGGGVRARLGSQPLFVNCLIAANLGTNGVGVEASQTSKPRFVNCTIARNAISTRGSEINLSELATATLQNSIIWNENAVTASTPIYAVTGTAIVASNSFIIGGAPGVVGGGTTTGWQNMVSGNPMFVNPAAGNFAISSGSSCIDAGNNTLLVADRTDLNANGNRSEPTPRDLAGNPRTTDDLLTADTGTGPAPVVDVGAYEFVPPCTGDIDNNGTRNLTDLATLLSNFGVPAGATPAQGDTDNDRDIDLVDLANLLTVFGTPCP